MNLIKLSEGDELQILPETNFFYLGCCECNMVHRIVVKLTKKGIILKFHRYGKKGDKDGKR